MKMSAQKQRCLQNILISTLPDGAPLSIKIIILIYKTKPGTNKFMLNTSILFTSKSIYYAKAPKSKAKAKTKTGLFAELRCTRLVYASVVQVYIILSVKSYQRHF